MRQRKINDDELLQMLKDGKMQKEMAVKFNCTPVAVCKRLRRLLPQPAEVLDKYNLTDKEKHFCIAKASGKSNTQAALESFEVSSMASAKVIGSQLMDKEEIEMAINDLGKQLRTYMPQDYRIRKLRSHADNTDPVVSLKALDLSWKLDGSYAPEKHMNVNFDISVVNEKRKEYAREIQECEARLAELEAQLKEIEGEGVEGIIDVN